MSSSSPPPLKRRRFANVSNGANALSKPFKSPLKVPLQPRHPLPNQLQTPTTSTDHSKSHPLKQSFSATTTPLAPPSPPNERLQSSVIAATEEPPSSQSSPQIESNSKSAPPPTTTPPRTTIQLDTPLFAHILHLRKQQTALLTTLSTSRAALQTSTQALSILKSNTDPKCTTNDARLRDLIVKWRAASRAAAEEVFVGAKEKVSGMGGVRGLRDRERERLERVREWEAEAVESGGGGREREEGDEGYGDGDGEGGKRGRREDEGLEDEASRFLVRNDMAKEVQRQKIYKEKGKVEEEEDEEEEGGYTMSMMLKDLGIDVKTIGFDVEGQRWMT